MMHTQLHLRALLALASLAVAAGCERPTAPEVRDQIEKTEQSVLSGTGSMGFRLSELFANSRGPTIAGNGMFNDLISVQRDGRPVRYQATVFERVYLPPATSGGKPFIKRTLLAWDKDSERGLAIAADEGATSVTMPTAQLLDEHSAERIWHSRAFVVQNESNGREVWIGVEGDVQFIAGGQVGDCPFKSTDPSLFFAVPTGGSALGSICQQLQYTVTSSAELERRRTDGMSLLDRVWHTRHTVRIEAQTLSGSRIVTQCPDRVDSRSFPPEECLWFARFWRDPSQFAAATGLDATRLQSRQVGDPYFTALAEGTGDKFDCCSQSRAPVHYSILTPDGKTLRQATVAAAMDDSILKRLNGGFREFREGSHLLLLMPGQQILPKGGMFDPLIVDMTILPCPPGLRMNATSFMGNAYPDGGCYPAANYPKPR